MAVMVEAVMIIVHGSHCRTPKFGRSRIWPDFWKMAGFRNCGAGAEIRYNPSSIGGHVRWIQTANKQTSACTTCREKKTLPADRRYFPPRQPIPRSRFSRSVMTRTASCRTVSLVNVDDDAPVCIATIWPSSRIASFMSRTRNLAPMRCHTLAVMKISEALQCQMEDLAPTGCTDVNLPVKYVCPVFYR